MDKLKSLLTTQETAEFSATEGSKRVGEFVKKHPLASKIFEQAHTNDSVLGINKEVVNALMEGLAPFAELIYPVIADMFTKVEALQEKLMKDKVIEKGGQLSLHVWLCNRIQTCALALCLDKSFSDCDSGKSNVPVILPEGFDISESDKQAITKMLVAKILFTNLHDGNYYTLNKFLDEIAPPPEPKIDPSKLN